MDIEASGSDGYTILHLQYSTVHVYIQATEKYYTLGLIVSLPLHTNTIKDIRVVGKPSINHRLKNI